VINVVMIRSERGWTFGGVLAPSDLTGNVAVVT